jgi:RNA polymerase sigma-B factor
MGITFSMRIGRPVQELMVRAREAAWQLAQELGRTPAESDITRHLGVSADELRHPRRAGPADRARARHERRGRALALEDRH